jgi:hypothetical protein
MQPYSFAAVGDGYNGIVVSGMRQASAATNFGTAISTAQTVAAPNLTGSVKVSVNFVQSSLGVGCGTGTNTATPTLAWTGRGRTSETLALTALSISANGALGSFQNDTVDVAVKQGTSVSYTTASTLALDRLQHHATVHRVRQGSAIKRNEHPLSLPRLHLRARGRRRRHIRRTEGANSFAKQVERSQYFVYENLPGKA